MEGDIVMGGFSHGQQRTIVMATQAAAALSFISSIIIVSANFRFKQVWAYVVLLVCIRPYQTRRWKLLQHFIMSFSYRHTDAYPALTTSSVRFWPSVDIVVIQTRLKE